VNGSGRVIFIPHCTKNMADNINPEHKKQRMAKIMQSFKGYKDIFLQIQNSTGELKVLTENTSFYVDQRF